MIGIFSLIISIALSIIVAYIAYWLLDSYGKSTLFKVNFIFSFLATLFSNLKTMSIRVVLIGIVSSLISALISTALSNWAYNKTNSFWQYFGLLLLVTIGIVLVLVIAGGLLGTTILGNAVNLISLNS